MKRSSSSSASSPQSGSPPKEKEHLETAAPKKRVRKSLGLLSATLKDSKAAKTKVNQDMTMRKTNQGVSTFAVLISTNYKPNTSIGSRDSRMYTAAVLGDHSNDDFSFFGESGLKTVQIPHRPTSQEKNNWANKNGGDSKVAQVPRLGPLSVTVGSMITVSCFGPENNPDIVPVAGDILRLEGVSFGMIRHKVSLSKNAQKYCDLQGGAPKMTMSAAQVFIHKGSSQKMLSSILKLPGAGVLAQWKPEPLPLPYPEPEAPDVLPPLYGLPLANYVNHTFNGSPLIFPVHNGRVNHHLAKKLPGPLCGTSKENALFAFFQETPQDLIYDNQNKGQMEIVVGTGKNMCTLLLLEHDPSQESGAFERGVVQIGVTQDATSLLGITSQASWEACAPSLLRGFQGNLIARSTPDSGNLRLNNEHDLDTWGAEAWANLQVDWLDTLSYAALRIPRAYAKERLPKMKFQSGSLSNPLSEEFMADSEGTPVVNMSELKGASWDEEFQEKTEDSEDDVVDWEYYLLPTHGFMLNDMNAEREMLIQEVDIKEVNDRNDPEAAEEKIREIIKAMPMSRWENKDCQVFAVNRALF